MYGIFPGHGDTHNQGSGANAQDGLSPPSNPTPSSLTPGDSQRGSSATSYSPGREDDLKTTRSDILGNNPAYHSIPTSRESLYMENSGNSGHDDSSSNSLRMHGDQNNANDAFTVPPGWGLGTETTPPPSGMNPPADGNWANLHVPPVWDTDQSAGKPRKMNWETTQQNPPIQQFGFQSVFHTDSGTFWKAKFDTGNEFNAADSTNQD